MRIGIAGPILIDPLREFLDGGRGGAPALPGGMGGTPVVHLVRELLRRGRRVVVVSLDPTVTDKVVRDGDLLKIVIGPYRQRARDRALDGFAAERSFLRQAIREEDVDIVHAHWTYEFALGALDSGLPALVTAHDAPFNVVRHMPDAYRMIRLAMALAVARRARFMTAVSPYIAEHWRRRMFFRKEIRVVPNGIPDRIFEYGKGSDRRTPVCRTYSSVLSGWGRMKNAATLLKAFRLVREELPEARLILFGPEYGPGERAETWARREGLDGGIEFVGRLPFEELLPRMAAETEVFVLPSREESFSMAVVEAMAMRLPVIGGAGSGGLPFTLDHGNAGMLVDVRSPRELADAMVRMGRDGALRQRFADAGYRYARDRFSIEPVISLYEDAYERAAGRR